MRPQARYATAIELLQTIIDGSPVEKTLTAWARNSRYAGSRDRAAVRDIVFDALRRRRSLAWLGGAESGKGIILGVLLSEGIDPASVFSGEGYAPQPLTSDDLAATRPDLEEAPEAVRLNYPDFLKADLDVSLGERLAPALMSMQQRAPIDVRVNLLKSDIKSAKAALANDQIETTELAECSTVLRVVEGGRKIASSQAYRDGLIELQDIASQMAAEFAGAKPGMTVLDYCAGGGGKTLALAPGMQGEGRLVAHDINPKRMKDIPNRATRAGAKIEIATEGVPTELIGACDLVFVDAPCSGSGAWRRNPNEKWRITPEKLKEFNVAQRDALQTGLTFVRSGGRLVYATCSMFVNENQRVVDEVLTTNPKAKLGSTHTLFPDAPGDGFYFADIVLS